MTNTQKDFYLLTATDSKTVSVSCCVLNNHRNVDRLGLGEFRVATRKQPNRRDEKYLFLESLETWQCFPISSALLSSRGRKSFELDLWPLTVPRLDPGLLALLGSPDKLPTNYVARGFLSNFSRNVVGSGRRSHTVIDHVYEHSCTLASR